MRILLIILSPILTGGFAYSQEENNIEDFYEYANRDWLDSTVLNKNTIVINNWGILWDSITAKSVEILSGDSIFDLDKNHLYALNQLRDFYKSSINKGRSSIESVRLIQNHFPMLFGIVFSEITISTNKEKKVKELIKYLSTAYAYKIENSNKIDRYYKELFLAKLNKMEFEIGAPAISYFPIIPELSSSDLDKNILISKEYQAESETKNLAWETPPFETDCRYNYYENKVKIYAGILFDSHLTNDIGMEYLYATLGRTIGHEMTHAFDKTGKNYDGDGKRISRLEKLLNGVLFSNNNWDDTYASLINQYNKYYVLDSLSVSGEVTLQENFADLSGVEISLLALKLYMDDYNPQYFTRERSKILEKYFISYARFWREKGTPEYMAGTIQREHAPQKFRAIGPIYNQDEFYEVFKIDKNSEFFIKESMRVRIWE